MQVYTDRYLHPPVDIYSCETSPGWSFNGQVRQRLKLNVRTTSENGGRSTLLPHALRKRTSLAIHAVVANAATSSTPKIAMTPHCGSIHVVGSNWAMRNMPSRTWSRETIIATSVTAVSSVPHFTNLAGWGARIAAIIIHTAPSPAAVPPSAHSVAVVLPPTKRSITSRGSRSEEH